jgi:hypothetical protein
MERAMWTDERLGDRFDGLDNTLDRVDRVDRDIRELRTDLRDMRTLTFQLWGSTIIGLIGVIATILVRT